jgi:hypothetical protein
LLGKAEQLTAAFAMNIAKAKLPVSLGNPNWNNASSSRTPPANTLSIGYLVPFSVRSLVDMNGRELAPQPLP